MAASLIERLPDENDPQWPMEERLALDIAAVAYVGLWWCDLTLNGRTTDSFASGGADTVSQRHRISVIISSMASLDNLNGASIIPGIGIISGSPEESPSRD